MTPFAPPPGVWERRALPAFTVALASLVAAAWPVVADRPLLPPLGLVALLAWRLPRPGLWPLWAGLPLGLWDDLVNANALGTAAAGWTAILLALDVVDRRLSDRDWRRDWAVAGVAILAQALLGWGLARLVGPVGSPLLMALPVLAGVLAFPAVARAVARIDRVSARA